MADSTSSGQANAPSRTMADLLFLPTVDRAIVNWLLKQQRATLTEIAVHVEQNPADTQARLTDLIAQGFIQSIDQEETRYYQPHLISRKGRQVPSKIWDALM